ncbi:hypothetical protein EVA_10985 [gut metagenome]|uniref:Uncharacterized protein n=1 Tax=gut metagenome TaxID=749906 RepID=J9G233_9ZZZZ
MAQCSCCMLIRRGLAYSAYRVIPVPLLRNSVSSRCSFGCEADIILKNTLI